MRLEPFNWDVVIVGHWNRAILTPNGIAKRLFKLEEGTGIEVFVPVNVLEPAKVKHEGIVVTVEERRLVISTVKPSYKAIQRAMQTGCNALKDLPETPVFATGFNIRFKITDYPAQLDEMTDSWLDTNLSDAGYEIVSRGVKRQIRVKGGILAKGIVNLLASKREDKPLKIDFNFHRDSNNVAELIEWLDVSEANLNSEVSQVLKNLSLNFKETEDE